MPEPLKNLYTPTLIEDLAGRLHQLDEGIDESSFSDAVFCNEWADLELKQRMRHITETLYSFLPQDYLQALPILVECSRDFTGFEVMFFPEYVELYGQQHIKESLLALEVMTQYSSSEFAVRPFIINQPELIMQQMLKWSRSKNHHVRRLSSEGCRPRLPWAMALPAFKNEPSLILPILENLKNDPSEYVRRSVTNNLNDISKDNPDTVIKIAQKWFDHADQTNWVIKHGCRTLLKQGHSEILNLFGFKPPEHIQLNNFKLCDKVSMGQKLEFEFQLSAEKPLGLCRIEYRLYFQKANQTLSAKVFKISEGLIKLNSKNIVKQHSFKLITTRKYHRGLHQIEIIVNGRALGIKDFHLI